MAHTITGKLNKAATQFQANESTGFGLRLGVKYYDRESKKDEYTNYDVVVFAKAPAQVKFYQDVLVEGAVVEVSGDKQKIRQFQGQNGLSLSIELLDAKLGFVHAQNQQPQQQPQQQQPQRQAQQPMQQQQNRQPPQGYQGQMPQQPQRQQGQSNSQGFHSNGQQFGNDAPIDFEDDIPFN
jgi:single-strand DNA-binding protein